MYYEIPYLEKGSRTYICPNCGQMTLKKYMQYGKYIHDTIGRCNREDKCGYHKPPREYWKENNIKSAYRPIQKKQTTDIQEIKPIGYVSGQYILDYAQNRNNNLIYYLLDLFDWETIKRNTNAYFLGAAKDRAVVYWQIDENGKCRTGKIQKLNKDTGRREKGKGAVNWVHDKLKWRKELPKDFNLQMCLFGLHLIRSVNNKGKTICICESEKSAIIAACCMPDRIWMAAGALHWLNVKKLKPLKGWNIILFPDTSKDGSAFALWSKIADEANRQGLNVIVFDKLEKECTVEEKANGFDIADYLIRGLSKLEQPDTPEPEQPINEPEEAKQPTVSTALSDMINENPVLKKLIDEFDLVEVATN